MFFYFILIIMTLFLPFLIHVFHVFIVLFVILVPCLIHTPSLLLLHIVGCISLLIHWLNNDNSCSLTLLECSLRGISKEQALSHRFIAPLYNVSDNEWTTFLYIFTIILMCIAFLKLYYNKTLSIVYYNFCKLYSQNGNIHDYIRICKPLFDLKNE
jgi:hypothetical protein